MVNEWLRVALLESRYQYTMSARINTLGAFAGLVVFESLFFGGVFWIFSLSRIHAMPEVSHRGSSAGNDLCIFSSYESSPYHFATNCIDNEGYIFMTSNYSANLLGENLLSIF